MPKPDFTQITVKAEESKKVLIGLLRDGLDVYYGPDRIKVVGSDPLLEAVLPCVGVNIASDTLQGDSIGQSEESWYDEDPTSPTYQKWISETSVFFEEAIEVRVWHLNADERDKLRPVVKAILFASLDYLTELGYTNIQLGNGRDEQDSATWAKPLFWYTTTIRFWNILSVKRVVTDAVIESVAVIPHSNPSGL